MRTPVNQFVADSHKVSKPNARGRPRGRGRSRVVAKVSADKNADSSPAPSDDELATPPHCFECQVDFVNETALRSHLLYHVKQPSIRLSPIHPLKITIKSTDSVNFEIISPKLAEERGESEPIVDAELRETEEQEEQPLEAEVVEEVEGEENTANTELPEEFRPPFSPEFVDVNQSDQAMGVEPIELCEETDSPSMPQLTHEFIPGAEPTPPPEAVSPSDTFPKIRIKTSGLLKEALTASELAERNSNDDNNYRGPASAELEQLVSNRNQRMFWPSMDNPTKDDNALSTLFKSASDQAKSLGLSSSDNEFIRIDGMDKQNRNALQLYSPNGTSHHPLDSVAGVPMQQLAEQVSRLQPNSGGGMHQQNVLINIQQFPQAPNQTPPHGYQPPPPGPPQLYMHPSHQGMGGQPMYPPPPAYQFQPAMYYPRGPGYPPHMQPGPPLGQPPHMAQHPPISQAAPHQRMGQSPQMPPPPQPPQYRPVVQPRQFNMQSPRGPAMRQSSPMQGVRAMLRPRSGAMGGPRLVGRPRLSNVTIPNAGGAQGKLARRPGPPLSTSLIKKKRVDIFLSGKDEDSDCQVIAVQPKNADGGLPQIQSVQGGQKETGGETGNDSNIMHLSDSITLSVRNPPRLPSPKKSESGLAVANILATRGITVTSSGKARGKGSPTTEKESATIAPVAINLNNAVSIIPTAKNKPNDSNLPTVDLTDESSTSEMKKPSAPPKGIPRQSTTLPFRCDLCPAQYPTVGALTQHQNVFHRGKVSNDIGVPLIDIRQPGVIQKLNALGIQNFVPLVKEGGETRFAMPVISINLLKKSNAYNLNELGANNILSLGPIRSLPKSSK